MTQRLIRNRAKCLKCGDVVESKHRHDRVTCSCWSDTSGIFVDGGLCYARAGWHEDGEFEDLCEYEEIEAKEGFAFEERDFS